MEVLISFLVIWWTCIIPAIFLITTSDVIYDWIREKLRNKKR